MPVWVTVVAAPWHFWNDQSFYDASLSLASLLGQDDQRATALAFFGAAIAELTALAGQGGVRT